MHMGSQLCTRQLEKGRNIQSLLHVMRVARVEMRHFAQLLVGWCLLRE
jgi:hypothetical protein